MSIKGVDIDVDKPVKKKEQMYKLVTNELKFENSKHPWKVFKISYQEHTVC